IRTLEVNAVPGARPEPRRLVRLPVPVSVPQREYATPWGLVSDEHIAVGRNRNVAHSGGTARRRLGVVYHQGAEPTRQIQAAIVGIADRMTCGASMGCLGATGRPSVRLDAGHHRSEQEHHGYKSRLHPHETSSIVDSEPTSSFGLAGVHRFSASDTTPPGSHSANSKVKRTTHPAVGPDSDHAFGIARIR